MNTVLVSQRHASFDVRFWLWWVAATTVGWVVGFWTGFFLGHLALGNLMAVFTVGIGVGLMQWLVLQLMVPHSGWWAPAGAAGLVLPVGLFSLIWGEPSNAGWLLAALVGGGLAGVFQHPILRRSLARTWWWVAASAAGWGLGLLGFASASYIGSGLDPESPLVERLAPLFFLLQTLTPGLLLGAVSGGALVWLRRQSAGYAPPVAAPSPALEQTVRRRFLIAVGVILALVPLLLLSPLIWINLTTPAEYRQLVIRGAGIFVRGAEFSPDGTLLATTSLERGGALIDLATGRELLALPSPEGAMFDIAFSPDGALLATADDRTVRLWDAASGAEVRTFPGQGEGALRVVFSPDGTLLATASSDSTVKLLDVASGAVVHTLTGHTFFVHDVAFSPDGSLLATASGDGTVKLWDLARGVERRTIEAATIARAEGEQAWVRGVAFSPDGMLLASTGNYEVVQLWDVASGAEVRTMRGHTATVWRAAFSPDGMLLATASDDQTVRLWEVASGAALRTLEGHKWWVRGVAFSPDGSRLATASFDGTVKLWDVTTGKELQSIAWPGTP